MQNIYAKYSEHVSDALKNGKRRSSTDLSKADSFSGIGSINNMQPNQKTFSFFSKDEDDILFESLTPLEQISGIKPTKQMEKLGCHPEFIHLWNTSVTEKHYAVSVFMDIKGSTDLFKKYEPETVGYITTTILRAAIHTAWHFGGYVQRLQGDGIMIYFSSKQVDYRKSVDSALQASSLFSYFVKNDIKRAMSEFGVENIYTRIGIDMGYDTDVLWHYTGMGNCGEITTCSLHTNLAPKMQGNAKSNGIVVGDNVLTNTTLDRKFFTQKPYEKDGKSRTYIYEIPDENFRYSQWEFDWSAQIKEWTAVSEEHESITIRNQPSRVQELLKTAASINNGSAFIDRSANFTNNETGVKSPDHRFHYE